MTSANIFLALRAALFALVINAPYITEFITSNGHSPNVFSDSDETIYLRQAYYIADNLPMQAIYKEHAQYTSLSELILSWRPDQTFTHLVVGVFANIFSLSILELNLVLDIFSAIIAYLLFVVFVREIVPGLSVIRAEIAAFFFLSSPWVFCLENYFTLHSLFPAISTTFPFMSHSCLPIQEAVETQLSVIWMILCLYLWNKSRSGSVRALILAGISHGLFIYVYALGWLGIGALIGVLFITEYTWPLERKRTPLIALLKKAVIFSSSSLLVSFPGLFLVLKKSLKEPLYSSYGNIYSQVWYFPVEWLIVLLLSISMLLFIRRINESRHTYSLALLFSGALFAEFLILNSQPLVGTTLCGLYILVFFLRPIMATSLVILLLSKFSEKLFISRIFLIFYFLLLAANLINGNINFTRNSQFTKDTSRLVEYMRKERIENSVLAMITYQNAFSEEASDFDIRWEPNAIAAITNNYLAQEAIFTPSSLIKAEEVIEREMLLGLLFSGKPRLIRECISEIETEPKYNFFLQWVSVQSVRVELCRQTAEYQKKLSACDLINNYNVDYIILETKFQQDLPFATQSFAKHIWTSENNEYQLYKFDRRKASQFFCH